MRNSSGNEIIFSLTTLISGYLFYYIYLKIQLKKITSNMIEFKILIFVIFTLIYFISVMFLRKTQLPYRQIEEIRQVIMGISIGGGILANLVYHRKNGDNI